MNVQAQKSGRRTRQRPPIAPGRDGRAVQVEREKDVQQLVAADAEARTADHQVAVALAAYFIAEKRGFEPGHELDDWLAAEAEIALLRFPRALMPGRRPS